MVFLCGVVGVVCADMSDYQCRSYGIWFGVWAI